MSEIEELCENLRLTDIDLVVKSAFRLAELEARSAIPQLITTLKSTESIKVRNAAAAALGELKANEALPVVIAMIRDPQTLGHRGSLAYALMYLNCRSHIIDLALLITDESYEVRQKALIALDSIDDPGVPSQLAESIHYINTFIANNFISREQLEDINQFIQRLEDWVNGTAKLEHS